MRKPKSPYAFQHVLMAVCQKHPGGILLNALILHAKSIINLLVKVQFWLFTFRIGRWGLFINS